MRQTLNLYSINFSGSYSIVALINNVDNFILVICFQNYIFDILVSHNFF